MQRYKVGILATHPIQYYVPWYRALSAAGLDLRVYYCHRATPRDQAEGGFAVEFEWDVPLLEGYAYEFLVNRSASANTVSFFGCDTPSIAKIIQEKSFDAFIVQGWNVLSFWQAMRACWRTKTPLLVRGDSQLLALHSAVLRFLKYPFYRWFIPKFDAYLVVGERSRRYYLHYGARRDKMYFVPHAVDNQFFAERAQALLSRRQLERSSWGIDPEAVVFLFAAKLIPKKRPFDFVAALEIASVGSKKISGLVVGDGPLRQEMEAYVNRHALAVKFTGFLNQTRMPAAYAVSDALVLTSDSRETWGLVVNEAMSCALPAIVSDQAGCVPDLVRAGQTGVVFRTGDIHALARQMAAFAGDHGRLREMGQAAREQVSRYSIDAAVAGTLEAIGALKR